MRSILFILFSFSITSICLTGQVIFEESFDSGNLDPEWEIVTMATDGGWNVGNTSQLSSQFFPILDNGSASFIATNDDGCDCNKLNDRLITPLIDLTGLDIVLLSYDLYYNHSALMGSQERASVSISTDKVSWTKLKDLTAVERWQNELINLSLYAGQQIYIAFDYSDGGGWLYGCALDNIKVSVPNTIDAAIHSSEVLAIGAIGVPHSIPLVLFNNGLSDINEIEVGFSVNGLESQTQVIENLAIPEFQKFEIMLEGGWLPEELGTNELEFNIVSVNGLEDQETQNNSYSTSVEIYEDVRRKNIVDEIAASSPNFIEIGNSTNNFDKPTDLDFFPVLGKNELWVINQRFESSGGSTVIIRDATIEPSDFELQVDGNAWHFMSLPTALAFSSDNHNFASSPGVQDANHNGGTFTGPTLWSSDPSIYARPSGGNGSHLDMLHGSPFSMGIAHEKDNVFWVFDGYNREIVRYDFVDDHGPGNDDHSDASVRRYRNIGIGTLSDFPNHLILDKDTGWLYFTDNGSSRVMRLDINSGNIGQNLPDFNEPLAEHATVVDFTVEEIVSEMFLAPCGIDLIDNRLLVSDYASGDIILYDTQNNFAEVGRIVTGKPGITGITVGPEGNIWYTNREQNTVTKIEEGDFSSTQSVSNAMRIEVYPNPNNGSFYLKSLTDLGFDVRINLDVHDVIGHKAYSAKELSLNNRIDLSDFEAGIYYLRLTNEDIDYIEKIVIQK